MNNKQQSIEWVKIENDINGNPRYVCSYFHFLTDEEISSLNPTARYKLAVKRANTIGGKKYNTKSYSDGIVISTYNTTATEKQIKSLTVTPIKKGDILEIIGKKWFDETYGNTYFSSIARINGVVVCSIPFEYGYDDQYVYQTYKLLQQLGYLPDVEQNGNGTCEALFRYAKRKEFTQVTHATDVPKRKDL